MAEITPMMQQYFKIKETQKDAILFYRLGDFYEMFFEDAKIASRELELVLTGRDCGQEERAPMCGVPFHAAEGYVARLVSKGYKVAICEQTEDPALAKGLVSRDIIRIVTPGTVTSSLMLDESRNNYLASVCFSEKGAGVSFCDISTGTLYAVDFTGTRACEKVINELARFEPTELLFNPAASFQKKLAAFLATQTNACAEYLSDAEYSLPVCEATVTEHFSSKLEDLGLEEKDEAVCAVGAALNYLYDKQKNRLENIREIHIYNDQKYMSLDASSMRSLEIIESERRREKKGSLLWVTDKTKTAMGKRLIRSWLEQPLVNVSGIIYRQNAVEELYAQSKLRSEIVDFLVNVNDIERIITRVVFGSANAKELKTLCDTIDIFPKIKEILSSVNSNMLKDIKEELDALEDIRDMISASIDDEPPFSVREGGMIRSGFSKELDELREIEAGGKGFIAKIEHEEQEKTGIKKLKIGYNRVFGYYIEVPNMFKDNVPEAYIRKQTLSNCERFITQELKELEAKVLGAQEKIVRMEYEIFCEIRSHTAEQQFRIKRSAGAIAKLDTLCSLANVAVQNNYCRPVVDASDIIEITGGRHPVVELFLDGAPFVPNDTLLDCRDNRTAIITGPNMAGKSTYMRQIALIVLLAQIGSFVPAKSATIGIVDSIFTRIGASDDLSAGKSTFMTEMSEVSSILKAATKRSLIILDEIGRGTSTFDGMSIARAVLEYVTDLKKLGAKTLFATHYHELTEIEQQLNGVKNYNTSVKKRGDEITFLRRIVRGCASGSYGIEVAKLAGIPSSVVTRAKVILAELESHGGDKSVQTTKVPAADYTMDDMQLSLQSGINDALLDEIRNLDTDTLTPIEALTKLYEIKNKIV